MVIFKHAIHGRTARTVTYYETLKFALRAISWNCFLLIVGIAEAFSQAEMQSAANGDVASFYTDLVSTRSTENGRSLLSVYLKIPYDELQFVRTAENRFRAVFETSIVVLDDDEDGFQVDGKIWKDTVEVDHFDQTNSRLDLKFTQASFNLEPGSYRLNIGMMDLDSRQTVSHRGKIEVRDYSGPELAISDVLIADAMAPNDQGRMVPQPQVAAPRRTRSELFAYFEVYDYQSSPQYEVTYQLRDTKGKKVVDQKTVIERSGKFTPVSIKLPNADLSHGRYQIRIEVKGDGQKAVAERPISLHWEGIPATVADLDEAVEQLRYIAKKDEVSKMKDAPSEKRRQVFLEFWRSKDPTPGTDENELMNQYYERIQYANHNFGSFSTGWKSDMGMVYVIFGPPNDIERNPYNLTTNIFAGRTVKAYEIWNYYEYNRQFVFIDELGYGDYRLYYPVSIDEYLR